jgi:hypothetical protein
MKTKILPMIWYGTAVGTLAAFLVAGRELLALKPIIAVLAGWPICIITALWVGSLAVKARPDLRFSTKQHVDGLGYVHQPMAVVVYLTFLSACLAIVAMLRR